MTPERLRRLASAVYGTDWQAQLSRDAGVNPRTVRRWARGDSRIPDDIEPLLLSMGQRRIAEIARESGASAGS